MNAGNTRALLVTAVLFLGVVGMGAAATVAVPTDSSVAAADDVLGQNMNANETIINVTFIGTVADERTVTVEASNITDNGTPVDGVNVTVTVGGEAATTATAASGELTAEFDPATLGLEPTDSAEVGLQGYNVTDPATVEVVHEAFDLDASSRLRSIPQGAELAVENVTAVNVWDAAAGTYDAVTDPVFETAANLHQGLYITPVNNNARVGYTFNNTTADLGTVDLSTGWNFASSNFDISATANLTVAEDLNLVSGNASDLDVFTAEFSEQLNTSDPVAVYDGYWVFVEESDQPVERDIVNPAYDRDDREDVLGIADSTVNGTVTASGDTARTDQAAGDPIPDANVTLYAGNSTDPADEVATTTTDQNGAYEFQEIAQGTYTVEAAAENFTTESTVLVVEDSQTADFALDYADSGSIAGEIALDVVDPGEDVSVTVEVVETGNSTTVTLAGGTNTTSYTIADVNVNVDDGYTVTVTSDSGNYTDPADAENVTVDVGATTTGVNFTFERQTGGANGTVVASGETASTQQTSGAGEGIENATIEVYAFQDSDSGSPTFTFENATGPNGTFDLPTDTFPVGEHFVVVDATNFTSAGLPVTITEGENDLGEIALDYADSGSISGEIALDVVDPGEDVSVTVEVVETGNTTTVTLAGGTNTTSYTIADVDVNVDDGYTVTATSDSGNYTDPADATNVTVDVGATTTGVDFGFTRQTGGANGTVVASGETASTQQTPGAGEGIENATIEVYAFQDSDSGSPTFTFENATGPNGTFDLPTDTFPVGEHFVVVDATNFTSAGLPVTITEGENDLGNISLDYADSGSISGEITLDMVDPNEDVSVTVTVVETGNSTTVTLAGGTNTTSYTIPDVDVNVDSGYTVSATSDSGNYTDPANETGVQVGAGETTENVNFTFERQTGGANGTVAASGETASSQQTPGAGEGIENATIEVYAFQDGDTGAPTFTFENATGPNGAFDLPTDTFPVGGHFVVVDATNFTSAGLPVTITEGENDLGNISLDYADSGSIAGEITLDVVDPDEDVSVTVEVVETGNTTTVTLAGGTNTTSYTITGVDVNVDDGYTVTATSDSGNYTDPADATDVTVDVGATTTGVDFGFTRQTGSINGTVLNNDTGSPIEGATVNVSAFGAGGPVVATATTDASGEYSIGPLPVGEHLVTVSVNGSVAGEKSATIDSDQTTTVDFAFNASTFTVDIADDLAGVAGETQTANITVENTGDLPGEQTIDLDWDGEYNNSTTVSLGGGASTVVALSVTTASTQALGFYNVTATSEDDTDEANATVGPARSLNTTTVAPGGTVNVTVSGQVGESGEVQFADAWSPPANDSEIVSTSFVRGGLSSAGPSDVFVLSDGAVSSGPLEIVYEIYIPNNDTDDTVYEWEPAQEDGSGSYLQVGDDDLPVLGDQSFEVDVVDSVLLDSVSSLLNESGQPFTSQQQAQPLVDSSVVALAAEPSATNEDSDGDGDAVTYPDASEIPVLGADGGVVGVTGPFVTTDTDFANYGNEEIMLNLYDELLGGSGTVVHDEGHGQYYTLAPNGGDDFQAFADYAESNGYTYDNTTDIQNATDTADAFVITSPSEAFTQSELDALSTFVDNGGVMFLHDQSDFSNFDATANHNEIAAAVNASFRFNDDQVVDDQNNTGARFVPETGNFNAEAFGPLFSDREGLGFELDVNETYEVDVTSVTDGDTVSVEFSGGTVESVRIVGIDTPETGNTDERLEEYEGIDDAAALKDKADQATAYAENLLANKTVNLTFSPTEGLRGDFGRLLGFLELDDGSVFNEEIVRDGWARVYDSGFAQHDAYWDLEQQARANGSGIWNISDPAATPEIRDDPVTELFFPQPVAVTGPETPVSSESGEPLVAVDRDANVAALGGPLVEERFETAEGGPGIDQYEVFPFLTNVMEAVGNATGPVVVDAGHNQFGVDYAVSAEDTAYYMRYLEGQSPGNESFIGLDGTVDLASEPGPDLLDSSGSAAARAVIISTPSSELSPAERTTVADFADAGGAVVLLGTAADTGALSNFDSLLNSLNTSVGFTGTNVTDATNNLGGDSSIPTTSNFSDGQFPELFTAFTPAEAGAPFNVSGLVPTDATVTEGQQFDVSATVTNEGTESDNQTIELRLEPGGAPVLTQTADLNASESTTVTFENVTVDQAGEYNHTVASLTDQATGSLTVESAFADVFLDSVSSLLNETQQPLTDDSITAIEAESTASNTDADGNSDAVNYPSDVDIPVVAVNGGVVGITGPFVTSDTDFANYSNEEFLLNVYDKLLGGSGTILHDEGHGQYYTLAPNGGDDFQTFAGFAESEGYTYDNTTDIQNATGTADAFVITSPSEAFTQSELDALSTFVDNGGAVFLHDQSDFNDFDATANHNEIAAAVNATFRFNDDQVVDDTNNAGQSFRPVTGNFNEATFPTLFPGASFNVSGLTPADATVSQGEAFDVSATVTNEGTEGDTRSVDLRLEPDGVAVATEQVQLDVGESTTVTFSDVTVEETGEYNHTVATPGDRESGSLTVELADVFLDSVSSLLNESEQPLTDDSITAIEAESTASNTDADGNGDAVNYPSDVDIPVAAVDSNVVGITGPFVTSDTDFASYSNEEIVLNVYDKLLGGSGTILHDEGHGQFYTLAPNGGDDFQAFAGYAENNGYTYDNTTDIQNATSTADAFVITSPSEAFTQSELDALSTFVDNGGVVFLHDQSDFNDFDATANHNEIAAAVNATFRFNDDQVVDDTNNAGQSFRPVTGNFNEATFPALFEDRSGGGLTTTGQQLARLSVW